MVEGFFPKIDGDILYASEVNIFNHPIAQIYTGSGFNSSVSGANQTDAQDHELDAVGADTKTYVRIKITGTARAFSQGNQGAKVEIKIQVKETSGAYGDSLAYKTVLGSDGEVGSATDTSATFTLEWIHTLTAGEKSNGYQVKVFSQSTTENNASCLASYTNIQTSLEGIA